MENDQLNMRLTSREEHLPIASFVACLESTLSLLKGLEGAVSESESTDLKWGVSGLSMNSPALIAIEPLSLDFSGNLRDVYAYFTDGLRSIEQSADKAPRFFTQKMLEAAKKLANALNSGIARIEFFTDHDKPISVTLQTVVNAEKLMGSEYSDYGSYEGTIELLSVHGGSRFNLYDNVYGRIECHLDKDTEIFGDLNNLQVKEVFSGRVIVSGMTRYTRTGHPASIRVESVRRLRNQSELPQLRDIVGVNLTGGVESAEYVRRLRNGD